MKGFLRMFVNPDVGVKIFFEEWERERATEEEGADFEIVGWGTYFTKRQALEGTVTIYCLLTSRHLSDSVWFLVGSWWLLIGFCLVHVL